MKHSFVKDSNLMALLLGIAVFIGMSHSLTVITLASEPTNPLTREYTITIDPTTLKPPTWWHVPGVTPLIWTKDPITYEAYRTTDIHKIKLKPGEYRFGTFTFDFAFRVTLEGKLEFAQTLKQCVGGQGTNQLVVRCSHTQPYKQERDYGYSKK